MSRCPSCHLAIPAKLLLGPGFWTWSLVCPHCQRELEMGLASRAALSTISFTVSAAMIQLGRSAGLNLALSLALAMLVTTTGCILLAGVARYRLKEAPLTIRR